MTEDQGDNTRVQGLGLRQASGVMGVANSMGSSVWGSGFAGSNFLFTLARILTRVTKTGPKVP